MTVACPAPPLLKARGARVVLGSQVGAPVEPLRAGPDTLFGPRGACLAGPAGPLFVCDTGHHRVLAWSEVPGKDAQPADLLLGHPDFACEGRGALNMPSSVAVEDEILAVADSWNHRVLIWRSLPQRSRPPDVVVSSGLFWCYGVAIHQGRLIVADTGNKRVLIWERVPEEDDAPADHILPGEMRWPHGIACAGNLLFVADAGAGIFAWKDYEPLAFVTEERQTPYGVTVLQGELVVADTASSRLLSFGLEGGAARSLAGQRGFADKGDNRWRAAARDSLCWPYGVSACGDTLVIADTGNNRVLLWDKA